MDPNKNHIGFESPRQSTAAIVQGESLEPVTGGSHFKDSDDVPLMVQIMKALIYRSHLKALSITMAVALLAFGAGVYAIYRADHVHVPAASSQQTKPAALPRPADEVLTIQSKLKVTEPAQLQSVSIGDDAVVGGALTVKGKSVIGQGLSVTGDGNFTGNVTAANFSTANLNVQGNGNFTGSLNVSKVATTSIVINGNGNFTGNVNISGSLQGNMFDASSYAINGVTGATVSCSSGNVLSPVTVNGGLVTSGTCTALPSGGGGGLPSDVAYTDVSNIFTAAQTLQAGLTGTTATFSGLVGAASLSGDGSAVTNVDAVTLQGHPANYFADASNLSGGTLSDSLLSADVTLQGNTFNGSNQLVLLDALGALPVLDGSKLTNLDAGNIANGTLGDNRLSSNVALLGSAANFTSTLQHNGNNVCDNSGNCAAYASASGSGSYIQNSTSVQTGASFFIQPSVGNVGAVLKANGADILDIQKSDGSLVASIDQFGDINAQTFVQTQTFASSAFYNSTATAGLSSVSALTVRGTVGQTAGVLAVKAGVGGTGNILEVQNSGGTPLARFDGSGNLIVPNVTVASQGTITMVGGLTSQRPASPTDGMLYYDTTIHQLLQYSSGLSKWVSDHNTANKIVAMGTASGCTGTSPVASSNPDGADYLVTSCTSAQTTINTAITALPASGGTVYLEDGTYVVDGAISIPSNVTLTGDGQATTLIMKDSIALPGFSLVQNSDTVNGNSRITISNLRLDGNQATQTLALNLIKFTKVGSTASNTPGFTISNIWAENSFGDAVSTLNSAHGTVTGSMFSGNGQGGFSAMFMNGGGYITVTGNTVQNTRSQGIVIGGSNYTISGNIFRSNSRGIYLNATTDSSVTGNSFSNNLTAGIISANASEITISGNSISNGTWGIQQLLGGKNNITGNTFDGNTGDNIYFQQTSNNLVSGNLIINNSASGFAIDIFDAASSSNTLSNNTFNGTSIHFIIDSGTGTIYSNQVDGNGNLITKSQGGGVAIGANSANASLTLQGGLRTVTLSAPVLSSTVTNVGTAGSTTYRYQVTAYDGTGETTGGVIQQTTTGNATLSVTNYNTITWTPVGGAYQYNIYRCTGAACTPAKLATVNGNVTSYNDQAAGSPSGSAPSTNTTGGATLQGNVGIGTPPSSSTNLSVVSGNPSVTGISVTETGSSTTGISVFATNGIAINASSQGVSSTATGVGGIGILGTATGSNGIGVYGTSIAGYSGYFQSASNTNVKATLVSMQISGQTSDLFQVQDFQSHVLAKFNSNGDLIIGGANSAASSNAFQVQDTSGVAFLTANSSTLTLTVKNVVITASLTVNGHIISGNSSGSTTYTVGAAANCGTGFGTSTSGNDTSGTVTVTTGSTCAGNGTLVTVTFANAFGSTPHVILTPANTNAPTLQYYVTSVSTNSFSINTNTNVTAATNYTFNYQVIQ